MTIGVATLAIATAVSGVRGDCFEPTVDVSCVKRLISATGVAILDREFATCDAADVALVAVYRERRLALYPKAEESRRYLDSLPATQRELSRVYELVNARGICNEPAVSRVVYGMFDTAATQVKKRRTHYREFIELCRLTDGEVGEAAWPAFDWLLDHDAPRMLDALRSLALETRLELCGGLDPRDLSRRDAMKRCRSGL